MLVVQLAQITKYLLEISLYSSIEVWVITVK